MHKNTCIMPWVHLYVDTRGNVKACCNANITFGNVNTESLNDIWNGEKANKFRSLTLAGHKDNRCNSCWKKETAGKSSMRTETLDKYQYLVDTQKRGKPIYLDIRFSNFCNLKCITCWHGASSSWFEEAKLKGNNWGDKAIIKATADNFELLDKISNFTDNIEEIYFAGGEPLMMEEHYIFLEKLISLGKTSTFLRYNTNLSLLELKHWSVIDLWKKFNRVEVAASIDAIGEYGENIRRGLNWSKFLNHIKLISTLDNIDLKIAPTVSSLNISSLHELHQYFVEQNIIDINDIYYNLLDRPKEYNIKNVGQKDEVKSKLMYYINWLQSKAANSGLISEVDSIVEYMG